jgi:hypothetical protein
MILFLGMAVREDDDFIDAEDGEGTGNVAAESGAKFIRLCAGVWLALPDLSVEEILTLRLYCQV